MKKIVLSIILCVCANLSWSQRSQKIAYIDMEYILENVPEYLEAQNTLDSKVTKWRSTLDKLSRFIEKSKTDLANEREILTNDLILEKEDEITLKQEELRRLESLYFGPNGDMFLLRKQLVKPIQDQVYNSLEDIVLKRKYDFVFAMESIYYADSMEKAIKKIYKLLKAGGQFFCGTDFYTDNKATTKWASIMKIQMHLHSKKEWKVFFKNAGFITQTKQIKDLKGNEKWKKEFGTLFIIGTKPTK